MKPEQCRAARALLRLEQSDLAALSGVARNTIIDFEAETRSPRGATVSALRAALETAGVVFLASGEEAPGGPGVRLAQSGQD